MGVLVLLPIIALVYLVYDLRYRAWVETKNKIVQQMIEVANLDPNDNIYDLGCGDGRILIAASRMKGVKGTGYEINPVLFAAARIKIMFAGLSGRVSVKRSDFFEEDLRNADVVFLYLFPEVLERLEPKLKRELRPGTKIVSNKFPLKSFSLRKAHPGNNSVFFYST